MSNSTSNTIYLVTSGQQQQQQQHNSSKTIIVVIVGAIIGGLIILTLIFLALCKCREIKRKKKILLKQKAKKDKADQENTLQNAERFVYSIIFACLLIFNLIEVFFFFFFFGNKEQLSYFRFHTPCLLYP